MDIPLYIGISALIIMLFHFAFNTNPKDFGLMQMIGIFAFAGGVGYMMQSTETAILMALVFSLIFI